MIAGKSNPEVACILSVSVVTIEKHLGSVFQKLNVENRTTAVTTAFELMKRSNGFE
ncbi:helix-turn-helix transcriptional regulator [Patescibacteria group bacterium]|nr:helix-turn-helix transcriptional regulator [Patescibacteria group bacterium]